MRNNLYCHPELDSGSSRSMKGFTLIELLVIVLIIGILAAVALPQYKKAILKSRYSALMPITKSLAEANEVYYLERGEYSNDPTELNIQGQEEYPDGTSILMYDENGLSYVRATNSNVPNARYLVYQKNSENFPGTTMCEASDDPAKALCVALGGEEVPGGNSSGESDWTAYLLTGGYGSTDTFTGNEENENTESQTPTCNEDEKPKDKRAGSPSGATGTAICVNGQWKYQWSGGGLYEGSYSNCSAADTGCAGITFSGVGSYCRGYAANSCADSIFSGTSSHCNAQAANACADSTISGREAGCYGMTSNGCTGAFIQAGAYCDARVAGGCDGAIYEAHPDKASNLTGCCKGEYCPVGSPKCGNWNDTTNAYDIDGTW